LDDRKILTGKPDQFDDKNPWVSCKFSPTNQSSEIYGYIWEYHEDIGNLPGIHLIRIIGTRRHPPRGKSIEVSGFFSSHV